MITVASALEAAQDHDASALQDCEIMSADTSTTDPGGPGERPTPLLSTMTSVYEFEEKDEEESLCDRAIGDSDGRHRGSKCYEKPKQRWLQKEQQVCRSDDEALPGERASGSEASGSGYLYTRHSAKPLFKRAKKRNGDHMLSVDGESDASDTGQEEASDSDCDEGYPSTPIPIKLKICRDPASSGSYRVVPGNMSENGMVKTSTVPGTKTRLVERCYTPDGRLLRNGDIVWAKITGYPFWPSRIAEIIQENHGSAYNYIARVDWFAWNQCSYIRCHKLVTFLDHMDSKFNTKNKNRSYLDAVDEAKRYAEQRILQDIMAKTTEETNGGSTPGARGARSANTRGGSRRGRPVGSTNKTVKPKQPRGRPRGSITRRGGVSRTSGPGVYHGGGEGLHGHAAGSRENGVGPPVSSQSVVDPMFSAGDLDWHLPCSTAENGLLGGAPGGLMELPDLGQLGFVEGMKCDIPTFSDDDDYEETTTLVHIDPDNL